MLLFMQILNNGRFTCCLHNVLRGAVGLTNMLTRGQEVTLPDEHTSHINLFCKNILQVIHVLVDEIEALHVWHWICTNMHLGYIHLDFVDHFK